MAKSHKSGGRTTPKGTRPAGANKMGALVSQARQLAAARNDVSAMHITGTAGGGAVTIVTKGDGDPVKITIDKSVIDPNDPGLLEDLVEIAMRDAFTKATAAYDDATSGGGEVLDGLDLDSLGLGKLLG